jgi:arylsulfatase A-like enzyme/Flp pilus assembly protein TadD
VDRKAPPSVVLVTVDTLRADRIGRGLTPHLDRLALEGAHFTAARANAPLTLPSHATIMTGALPPEHGARENGDGAIDRSRPTLARVLREAGYRTGAFVGAFVLDRRFGLDDGFETYDDRIRRDPDAPNRLEAERRAAEVVDAAVRWIGADSRRPFFLWVHLYDPHAPYDPPAEFLARAGGGAYDGEVAYADAEAGRLLAAARAAAGDRLLIAAAGDHGEGLGDHGESTHGMLAYDSTLRVPLIISGNGVERRRIDAPVSLRDLAPTLLALAGRTPPPQMTGADVLAGPASEIYAETLYPRAAGWSPLRVLVADQWKLVLSSEPELYDIRGDPAESTNASARHASVVSAMRARAQKIFASGVPAAVRPTRETDERLRALGYVSAPPGAREDGRAPNPATVIESWNRFERALSLMNAGRGREATTELTALARAHPDSRVFQSTLVHALRIGGRAHDALRIARGLITRWPDDAGLFHELASAAREAGDRRQALEAEQAALALDPDNANVHNGIGLLHADEGRPGKAAAAFTRASELDPSNASIWANLGNARRALGDLTSAVSAYERAIDIDPEHADAANGLGVVLVQQKRPREAIDYFRRALAADPSFLEARLNLGIALQENGQRSEAIAEYRKVVSDARAGSREKQAATDLLRSLR